MTKLPDLAESTERSFLWLKLFKIVFSSVGSQPPGCAENERMLRVGTFLLKTEIRTGCTGGVRIPLFQPYVQTMVLQSMELALRARDPINYFLLLRALFRYGFQGFFFIILLFIVLFSGPHNAFITATISTVIDGSVGVRFERKQQSHPSGSNRKMLADAQQLYYREEHLFDSPAFRLIFERSPPASLVMNEQPAPAENQQMEQTETAPPLICELTVSEVVRETVRHLRSPFLIDSPFVKAATSSPPASIRISSAAMRMHAFRIVRGVILGAFVPPKHGILLNPHFKQHITNKLLVNFNNTNE
ncbi:unnamed protein product [Gongylonema pulchrum]|uniref:Uncharacterized protein n=1 Tax=Gongylonema pulchrum TaxID=637853 RepID=A0A183EFP0_9BILA|nr:unnamed protein product [Gongylonema pulchrum]